MSWKCDICDSYNEERLRRCFVCGQKRSAESIKDGRIKLREERIAKADTIIINKIIGIPGLMYILGLSASSVSIVVALIIRIRGGGLDTIWQSFEILIDKVFSYKINIIEGNLENIILQCLVTFIEHLSAAAKGIWSVLIY